MKEGGIVRVERVVRSEMDIEGKGDHQHHRNEDVRKNYIVNTRYLLETPHNTTVGVLHVITHLGTNLNFLDTFRDHHFPSEEVGYHTRACPGWWMLFEIMRHGDVWSYVTHPLSR